MMTLYVTERGTVVHKSATCVSQFNTFSFEVPQAAHRAFHWCLNCSRDPTAKSGVRLNRAMYGVVSSPIALQPQQESSAERPYLSREMLQQQQHLELARDCRARSARRTTESDGGAMRSEETGSGFPPMSDY